MNTKQILTLLCMSMSAAQLTASDINDGKNKLMESLRTGWNAISQHTNEFSKQYMEALQSPQHKTKLNDMVDLVSETGKVYLHAFGPCHALVASMVNVLIDKAKLSPKTMTPKTVGWAGLGLGLWTTALLSPSNNFGLIENDYTKKEPTALDKFKHGLMAGGNIALALWMRSIPTANRVLSKTTYGALFASTALQAKHILTKQRTNNDLD